MIKELFFEFLRLGFIAFGGPAAHISFMHERFVEKKGWLDDKHFVDLMSLSSVIPGPSSTELVLLIGRHRGGILGLWIAGLSFILPALSMVLGLSYLYVSYGELIEIGDLLTYLSPVIIAIILYAVYKLSVKVIRSYKHVLWVLFAFVIAFVLNQIVVFIIVSLFAFLYERLKAPQKQVLEGMSLFLILWLFFQIGATLYGSGYVLPSYLNTFFVDSGWLTYQQVIDAITVGQVTPGPVFTTAGFVGYILSGQVLGGILGAIGIFLPGFLLITFLYGGMKYLRQASWFQPILVALNAAAIALMMHVVIDLISVDFSWLNVLIIAVSFALLLSKKVSSMLLIMLGLLLSVIVVIT